MPARADLPIVVIGGGIGGLSASIALAATGRRVILLEQQPTIGGKMSQVEEAGFRWDTGPSVITMRHVFDALLHLIHTTGVAALIATHNLELARRMDRVLRLEHGLLVEVAPASVR